MLRKAEARFIESENRWRIGVQNQGERRYFYSSILGKRGKHEAEQKADEWLQYKNRADEKISVLYEEYIASKQGFLRGTSLLNFNSIYKHYVADEIGKIFIGKLTRNQAQACIDKAFLMGKSKATLNKIKNTITCIADYAAGEKIRASSFKDLYIPDGAHEGQRNILSKKEIETLFSSACNTAKLINLFRLATVLGLRRGELIGLKWSDFATAQGTSTLTVNRAINYLQEETTGKTKNAIRTIVLPQIAIDILEKQKKETIKAFGYCPEFVFIDENGNHLNPNILYQDWKAFCKKYGISSLPFHSLRHTMISYAKSDLSIETIKSIVGHSATMNTTAVYGHAIEGELQQGAQAINKLFLNITKSSSITQ